VGDEQIKASNSSSRIIATMRECLSESIAIGGSVFSQLAEMRRPEDSCIYQAPHISGHRTQYLGDGRHRRAASAQFSKSVTILFAKASPIDETASENNGTEF
jgi:hypothetical protein